ncbi:MAG: hypothetical protein LBI36_04675 [Oscillospiraceae bacterium]|jgi:hypothetical protein|nr:hypothetical protein [Oscillospiraceae bacterium]
MVRQPPKSGEKGFSVAAFKQVLQAKGKFSMKYDVFMRTRTFGGDYTWVNKPDYMPADVYKTCQSIIALREKQSFDSLGEDDWYGNFFFIKAGGCCMLARMAKTKYSDSYGRSIFSFEGVSVKSEAEKRLFLDVPNLINAMLPPAKSFRARFEEEGSVPDVFEVESPINPLRSASVPREVHPAVKKNAAFRNLLAFIAYSGKPDGFIFGGKAKAFSSYVNKSALGIKSVFDFEHPEPVSVRENAFTESYKPVSCGYAKPVAIGKERTAVYIVIKERGKDVYEYCWQVRSLDGEGAKYKTKSYNITDRLLLNTLEVQKESIKKFMTECGWKKQQYGLRFEKTAFARREEG